MSTEPLQASTASSSTSSSVSQIGITGSYIVNSAITINQTIVYQYLYYDKVEKSTGKVIQGAPFFSQHFVGQRQYLDKIEQQLKQSSATTQPPIALVGCKLTGIYGLGGIGKTYLANYIIHHPPQEYKFRVWFDATTTEQLTIEYVALGEALHLFPSDKGASDPDNKLSLTEKINKVKQWLENNPNWLLVYDNAENMERLTPYLPNQGGHILVASRNHNWDNPIEIDRMTEKDAIELIEKLSGRKDPEIKVLVGKLGRLPLALAQAGAYIWQTKITVSKYIELYNAEKAYLLKDQKMPPGDKHEPVYVTWNLNTEAAAKKSKYAKEILSFCAYLHSSNIPRSLLIEIIKETGSTNAELDLNDAIAILGNYSLIQAYDKFVSMHCVLQDVIKEQQKAIDAKQEAIQQKPASSSGTEQKSSELSIDQLCKKFWILSQKSAKNYLIVLSDNLLKVYPQKKLKMEDYEHSKILIPHIEAILDNGTVLKNQLEITLLTLLEILGSAYESLGNYQKAIECLERALTIKDKVYGEEHIEVAKLLNNLGAIYINLGNYEKAKAVLERAFSLQKEFHAEGQEIARTLNNLGTVYAELQEFQKAIEYLERALTIKEKIYGKEDIEVAKTLYSLGNAYRYLNRHQERKELLERALAIEKKAYGEEHIKLAKTLNSLGNAYGNLGDHQKKKKSLEYALTILEKFYGKEHIDVAITLFNLGSAYGALGDHQMEKNYLDRALGIEEEFYGKEHIKIAKIHLRLGVAHVSLKLFDQAKNNFAFAYKIFLKNYGLNHNYTKMAEHNLQLLSQNSQKLSKDSQKNPNASASLEPNKSEALGLPHSIFSLTTGDTNMTTSKKDYFVNSLTSELTSMFARACTELRFDQLQKELLEIKKERFQRDQKAIAQIVSAGGNIATEAASFITEQKLGGLITGVGGLITGIIDAVKSAQDANLQSAAATQKYGNIRLLDLLAGYAKENTLNIQESEKIKDVRDIVSVVAKIFAKKVSERLYYRHADFIERSPDVIFNLVVFFRTVIRNGIFSELNLVGSALDRALRAAIPDEGSEVFKESKFKEALKEVFPTDRYDILIKGKFSSFLESMKLFLHHAPCLVIEQNEAKLLEDQNEKKYCPYMIVCQSETQSGGPLPYNFNANKKYTAFVGKFVTTDNNAKIEQLEKEVATLNQNPASKTDKSIQDQIAQKSKEIETLVHSDDNASHKNKFFLFDREQTSLASAIEELHNDLLLPKQSQPGGLIYGDALEKFNDTKLGITTEQQKQTTPKLTAGGASSSSQSAVSSSVRPKLTQVGFKDFSTTGGINFENYQTLIRGDNVTKDDMNNAADMIVKLLNTADMEFVGFTGTVNVPANATLKNVQPIVDLGSSKTPQPTSSAATPTSSSSSSSSSSYPGFLAHPTSTTEKLKLNEALIKDAAETIANEAVLQFIKEQNINRQEIKKEIKEKLEKQVSGFLYNRAMLKSVALNELEDAGKDKLVASLNKQFINAGIKEELAKKDGEPIVEKSTIVKAFNAWLKGKEYLIPDPSMGIKNQ
jgi:tetratricopeptide (TPR) repeat protein